MIASSSKITFATLGFCILSALLTDTDAGCFSFLKKKEKEEECLEKSQIDLNLVNIRENAIKYYKYVMLIYHQALSLKMTITLDYSRAVLKLEYFDDAISKRSKWIFTNENFETRYSDLVNVSINVLREYHKKIEWKSRSFGLSRIRTAFYYRALKWLEYMMRPFNAPYKYYNRLQDVIRENLSSTVAKNYLAEIVEDDRDTSLDMIEYAETIKRIADLENFGEDEDMAVEIFFEISKGGNIDVRKSREVVKAKREVFKKIFDLEPFQMLLYMDYQYNAQKQPTTTQARTSLDDYEALNIEKGTLRRWRYALISFYRAIEDKFLGGEKMDSLHIWLLELMSNKESPRDLRLSGIAFLYVNVLAEIDDQIKSKVMVSFVDSSSAPAPGIYYNDIFKSLQPESGDQYFEKLLERDEWDPNFEIKSTIIDTLNGIRSTRIKFEQQNQFAGKYDDFIHLVENIKERIRSSLNTDHVNEVYVDEEAAESSHPTYEEATTSVVESRLHQAQAMMKDAQQPTTGVVMVAQSPNERVTFHAAQATHRDSLEITDAKVNSDTHNTATQIPQAEHSGSEDWYSYLIFDFPTMVWNTVTDCASKLNLITR